MREKEEMGVNSILLIWCHRLTVLSYWVGFDRAEFGSRFGCINATYQSVGYFRLRLPLMNELAKLEREYCI